MIQDMVIWHKLKFPEKIMNLDWFFVTWYAISLIYNMVFMYFSLKNIFIFFNISIVKIQADIVILIIVKMKKFVNQGTRDKIYNTLMVIINLFFPKKKKNKEKKIV